MKACKKVTYKGMNIVIKEFDLNFKYFATKKGNNLILYLSNSLNKYMKSKVLHKSIKACRKKNH